MSISEKLNETLILGAQNGDLNLVKFLLQNGADIDAKDAYGQTALMKSVLEKHKGMSLYLIEQGADLDIQDCFKNTALMYSAFEAQEEVFETLLKKGASVHLQDERGETVTDLLYRCYQVTTPEKKIAYQRMISCFVPDFICREKQRQLTVAIVNGLEGVVSLMLEDQEVSANETDGATLSPLQWAAAFNRQKAAFCLIQNGAEIDYQDKNGMSALMYAAKSGHKEMVQLLLNEGASVCLQNHEGKTPALLAYENQQEEVFELIKQESMKRIMPQEAILLHPTGGQREKE